jgi:spoIIIJ-associated protein
MKDQVFEAATVEEAVAAAARGLGVPAASLRHVVLDEGTVAARGLTARPARIAVLLGSGAAAGSPSRPAPAPPLEKAAPSAAPAAMGVAEVASEIRELIRELARAADTDLSCEVTTTDEAVVVRVEGKGKDLLLEDQGDVLESLEYLIQLMYRRAVEPRRLVVDCEGYRADRDRALKEEALALAAAVAADGSPRKMRSLNSYERRVVHATLTDHPAVKTFSVGEGGERRVTVAPKSGPAGDPQG